MNICINRALMPCAKRRIPGDPGGLCRTDPSRFDLVITDMQMPGMTGAVLAAELFKIRPDIPIILCTGYSELMTEEEAGRSGFKDFLMKPFTLQAIASVVRKALNPV